MAFERLKRTFAALRAPEPPAPTGKEVAIADTRLGFFSANTFIPYNPDELASKKGGLRIYDKMRTDDQIKSCQLLKKCAIVGPGWDLDPGDDSEPAAALAEQLTADIKAMRGTFEDDLLQLLSALDYGFSVDEIVLTLAEGRLTIGALKARAPHDMDFEVDAFGNIANLLQTQKGGQQKLPMEKFVHFIHQPEFENPYGRSDLRECYDAWWAKTNVWQWWLVFAERFAIPIAKGTHPKNLTQQQKDDFIALLKKLQSNTSVRLETDWNVELIESTRDPKAFFENLIDRCDLRICKALLLPDKSGFSGAAVKEGSYSLAKEQADLFVMALDLLRKRLEACVQEQLINRVCALIAPTVAPPLFMLLPLAEDNRQALVTLFCTALTAGAIQAVGFPEESHIRQLLGFPEITEEEWDKRIAEAEAKAQEKQDAMLAAKAAAGGGGNGGGSANFAEPDVPTGYWRALNALEQRTDMAEKREAIESETSTLATILADGAQAIVEEVKDTAERLGLFPGQDPAMVQRLMVDTATRATLTAQVAAALEAAHMKGITQARQELQRARRTFAEEPLTFAQRPGLIGQQARSFFRSKALSISADLSDGILKKAKSVLLQSLKQDKTPRAVLQDLSESLADYLPERDAAGRLVNVPARIETIARTNTADAINEARYTTFTDPDLRGFVQAFKFSAILDDRTTPGCRQCDGVVRPIDDNWWYNPDRRPPNHFQCRSLLLPVTAGDEAEMTPPEELPNPADYPPAGFK